MGQYVCEALFVQAGHIGGLRPVRSSLSTIHNMGNATRIGARQGAIPFIPCFRAAIPTRFGLVLLRVGR